MKKRLIGCNITEIWQWQKTHMLSINGLLTCVAVKNDKIVIIAKTNLIK